jgi:mediator of RNA polymerase II transcription subunit 12
MTCLKGQDEQREQFLSSLHSQLSQFMFLPKEDRLFQCEDIKARQSMLEALQLRFSLVGGKTLDFYVVITIHVLN